ncbi:MAG: tungsten ABC transporter substrate-binding protein, partial [Alphaproteobacteria bacterium]|nr:tungsten ABC transporter substrate-binding protein [Alphaproteobacteria bacterium]
TDRATWLSIQSNLDLIIVCERSEALLNYYGVIAVNPAKNKMINGRGAQDFINWILLPATQQFIGGYGVKEFGEVLFTPSAQTRR